MAGRSSTWRQDILHREAAAGKRLLAERRNFNASLGGGGRATVVVRFTGVYLKRYAAPPTYPAKRLQALGWKKVARGAADNRHVLQGRAATQAKLVAILRAAWKGKMDPRGRVTIVPLTDRRRAQCKACLATHRTGRLWCTGKSKWNRNPAARQPSAACKKCLAEFCMCPHVGKRSGRTYGCHRCKQCL
jgi:hypothetical protein